MNDISKDEHFLLHSLGFILYLWTSYEYSVENLEQWIQEEVLSLPSNNNGDGCTSTYKETQTKLVFSHGIKFFLLNNLSGLTSHFMKKPTEAGDANDVHNTNKGHNNYNEYFYFQHKQIFPCMRLQDEKAICAIYDNVLERFSHDFVSDFLISTIS